MKPFLITASLLLAFVVRSNALVILIDDSNRNGGFESGVASPWGGISTVMDSAFTHGGSYYGAVSGTRGDVFQFLPISNSDGHDFSFSFWARIPNFDGYASLSVSLSDTGFGTSASVTPILEPALSSGEWRYFSYNFTTSPEWNDSGNSKISIAFPNSPGTRTAYVDDVTFLQVPEPYSMQLFAFAFLATIVLRRRIFISWNI